MILVTGYSGNTGKIFVEKFLSEHPNEIILGISRKKPNFNLPNLIEEEADLNNEAELRKLFLTYNIDSVIHIANIMFSSSIMKLCAEFYIKKIILIHTTGMYSKYRSYSEAYIKIEEMIAEEYSNLNYVILKPTMIYGNSRDYNISKIIKFIDKSPIVPIVGNGNSLLQPIYVKDLAEIILRTYKNPSVLSGEYIVSGGSEITVRNLNRLIAKNLNKTRVYIHVPKFICLYAVRILNNLFKFNQITTEQINRLSEDKNYSNQKIKELLNFNFTSIECGISYQVQEYNDKFTVEERKRHSM